MRELILYRRKFRFTLIGISQNSLRIMMLIFRLKVPYLHDKIHPIFASLCGIVSNLISIFKLFREKKQFIKLTKFNNVEY